MCHNNSVTKKDFFEFEWDEAKRQLNFKNRGVDFMDAADVLYDPKVSIEQDTRKDYGEDRYNAYGMSKGRRLRLCFTMRDRKTVRVISMFKVHMKEWEKHYEND